MLKRLSSVLFFILLTGFHTASAQDANQINGLRDLRKPPLELAGAKVSTEMRAWKIAEREYYKSFPRGIGVSATEGAGVIAIIPLGFDVPDFAQAGDKVWEVRVIDLARGLNAIMWVHSESEKVLILVSKATPGKHRLLVPQTAN